MSIDDSVNEMQATLVACRSEGPCWTYLLYRRLDYQVLPVGPSTFSLARRLPQQTPSVRIAVGGAVPVEAGRVALPLWGLHVGRRIKKRVRVALA